MVVSYLQIRLLITVSLFNLVMLEFSVPVFFLMLGAAVLGFLIAWVWIKNKMEDLLKDYIDQQENLLQSQSNYQDLLGHSNAQQAEKEKLIQKIDDKQVELARLQVHNKQLKEDKDFLFGEMNALREKKSKEISLPRQITGELASLKSQIDELTQEKENWREKYMIIRDANDEHIAQISALNIQKTDKENELEKEPSPMGKIDWREEFQQMQLELNKKLQNYQDSNKKLRGEYEEMKEHYIHELRNYAKTHENLLSELNSLKKNKTSDPSE